MAHKKIGWLKDTNMKDNGIFSSTGEKLVSGTFTTETQNEFNGKPKQVVKAKVKSVKKSVSKKMFG